jgi:hypothetical protein
MPTEIYCRECAGYETMPEPPLVAECPRCGSMHVSVTETEGSRNDALFQIFAFITSKTLRRFPASHDHVLKLARKHEISAAELLDYIRRAPNYGF